MEYPRSIPQWTPLECAVFLKLQTMPWLGEIRKGNEKGEEIVD